MKDSKLAPLPTRREIVQEIQRLVAEDSSRGQKVDFEDWLAEIEAASTHSRSLTADDADTGETEEA